MVNKGNVKVISFDLGGTLVDVSQGLWPVWRSFFGNDCSDGVVKNYWDRATEILHEKVANAAKSETSFKNLREIFEESFTDFFDEVNLDFDAGLSAEKWIKGHDFSNHYPEAKPFLAVVERRYKICLSSECDLGMLANISELYSFDTVFSSEGLKCYKLNPKFWRHVIQHYRLPPDNVLHVGDSTSDIVGPAKLGILTCWVNRNGRKWDHDVKPDFEVTSLSQIVEIVD